MINLERQPQAYTQEFDRKPEISPLYIKRQLETHIGERFNVLLSTTRYELKDGKIYGEGEDEPFTDVLIRGREYRKTFGNPVDREREDAEVTGFKRIEAILADPLAPPDSMVLSFSLRGQEDSTYQHNFYDIFTKKEDGIEARRYSYALGPAESSQFYLEMGFKGAGETADDVFFLANPIPVEDPRFRNADDVHKFLHREHSFTPVEEFEKILKGAQSSILKYAYEPTPFNFNEALNHADLEAGFIKVIPNSIPLGLMPVRQVMTGCGSSCGITSENSPRSVSEFGKVRNYKFDKKGPCRVCGSEALCGPVGICEKCNDKIDLNEALSRKFVL